jgi:hypothetical protein
MSSPSHSPTPSAIDDLTGLSDVSTLSDDEFEHVALSEGSSDCHSEDGRCEQERAWESESARSVLEASLVNFVEIEDNDNKTPDASMLRRDETIRVPSKSGRRGLELSFPDPLASDPAVGQSDYGENVVLGSWYTDVAGESMFEDAEGRRSGHSSAPVSASKGNQLILEDSPSTSITSTITETEAPRNGSSLGKRYDVFPRDTHPLLTLTSSFPEATPVDLKARANATSGVPATLVELPASLRLVIVGHAPSETASSRLMSAICAALGSLQMSGYDHAVIGGYSVSSRRPFSRLISDLRRLDIKPSVVRDGVFHLSVTDCTFDNDGVELLEKRAYIDNWWHRDGLGAGWSGLVVVLFEKGSSIDSLSSHLRAVLDDAGTCKILPVLVPRRPSNLDDGDGLGDSGGLSSSAEVEVERLANRMAHEDAVSQWRSLGIPDESVIILRSDETPVATTEDVVESTSKLSTAIAPLIISGERMPEKDWATSFGLSTLPSSARLLHSTYTRMILGLAFSLFAILSVRMFWSEHGVRSATHAIATKLRPTAGGSSSHVASTSVVAAAALQTLRPVNYTHRSYDPATECRKAKRRVAQDCGGLEDLEMTLTDCIADLLYNITGGRAYRKATARRFLRAAQSAELLEFDREGQEAIVVPDSSLADEVEHTQEVVSSGSEVWDWTGHIVGTVGAVARRLDDDRMAAYRTVTHLAREAHGAISPCLDAVYLSLAPGLRAIVREWMLLSSRVTELARDLRKHSLEPVSRAALGSVRTAEGVSRELLRCAKSGARKTVVAAGGWGGSHGGRSDLKDREDQPPPLSIRRRVGHISRRSFGRVCRRAKDGLRSIPVRSWQT